MQWPIHSVYCFIHSLVMGRSTVGQEYACIKDFILDQMMVVFCFDCAHISSRVVIIIY